MKFETHWKLKSKLFQGVNHKKLKWKSWHELANRGAKQEKCLIFISQYENAF